MADGGLLEWYKRKLLAERLTDEDVRALMEARDSEKLTKIDRQTSPASGVWQNVLGNLITDGGLLILKRLLRL